MDAEEDSDPLALFTPLRGVAVLARPLADMENMPP
jgi:hypothetical protein